MQFNWFQVLALGVLLFRGSLAFGGESSASSADWPQWRGPTRDGVASMGPKLLDAWPKEGPKLLWKSGEIPSTDGDKMAAAGGSGSPVVADGKAFLYVHWRKSTGAKAVITTSWLKELGWEENVPDDLAKKIEAARLAKERKDLAAAALGKYIAEFIAGLDQKPEGKLLDHIKMRLAQGAYACNWKQLTEMSGVRDKEFPSVLALDAALHHTLTSAAHGALGTAESVQLVGQPLSEKSYALEDVIVCWDANTGKELWKAEFPGTNLWGGTNWGASGTPTVSGGKCYVAGSAGMYCLSVKDGSVVWKTKSTFTHSSPLVADGKVFFVDGGVGGGFAYGHVAKNAGSALVALDANTGREVWRQPKVNLSSGSPVVWASDGKNYLLCTAAAGFSCVDPETSAVLWQDRRYTSAAFGGNGTPVVRGDIAYIEGCAAYKLSREKQETLWSTNKGGAYGYSAVIHQGYGYYGATYQFQQCFDLKTGERVWNGAGIDSKLASNQDAAYRCFAPVLAGDKIITYLYSYNFGKVAMLQATPEKCKELGAFEPGKAKSDMFLSPCASPALANGKLYLRLSGCVACYDLTEAGNK